LPNDQDRAAQVVLGSILRFPRERLAAVAITFPWTSNPHSICSALSTHAEELDVVCSPVNTCVTQLFTGLHTTFNSSSRYKNTRGGKVLHSHPVCSCICSKKFVTKFFVQIYERICENNELFVVFAFSLICPEMPTHRYPQGSPDFKVRNNWCNRVDRATRLATRLLVHDLGKTHWMQLLNVFKEVDFFTCQQSLTDAVCTHLDRELSHICIHSFLH